jgi:hypothetical protein
MLEKLGVIRAGLWIWIRWATMNRLQREHVSIHGKFCYARFGCSAVRLIIYSTTRLPFDGSNQIMTFRAEQIHPY